MPTRPSDPLQPPLFGQSYEPAYPTRFFYMQKAYGPGPEGVPCRHCAHLVKVGGHARDYIKCDLYGKSMSAASDWRCHWPACGQYRERAQEAN